MTVKKLLSSLLGYNSFAFDIFPSRSSVRQRTFLFPLESHLFQSNVGRGRGDKRSHFTRNSAKLNETLFRNKGPGGKHFRASPSTPEVVYREKIICESATKFVNLFVKSLFLVQWMETLTDGRLCFTNLDKPCSF